MTQRLAIAATAGLVAFIVVLMGALATYVALHPSSTGTALAARTADASAPPAPSLQGQAAPTPQPGSGSADNSASYPVSPDDAANIALSNAPGSSLLQQPRLVSAGGIVAYEVPLSAGNVYVDANTGQVLNPAGQRRRRPGR